MGINILTATGNLGRDAEQRFTPAGDSIVQFSVPVVAGFGKNQVTTWVNCSLWGSRGESVLPYLKKGQLVGVSGEFQLRKWTDKEGLERLSPELRCNTVQLLGSRPSETSASGVSQTGTNEQNTGFEDFPDDIPF
jgi:single-strand DNA-binding protein